MRALAEYVLRGRWQAVLIALLFTFIPFFGWIGVVIMALVTLRKGAKEGFFVLSWIILPIIVISIVLKDYRYALYDALGGSTVVWLMAIILRQTRSWLLVVQAVVLLAVITIISLHIADPNISQWWQIHVVQILNQFNELMSNVLTPDVIKNSVVTTAKIATGLQADIIILTNLFNLVIARWAQATLFNPGGLKQELHGFRLDKTTLIIVGIIGLMLMKVPTIQDCLPTLLLPFVLAGISLIHFYCELTSWDYVLLIVFYILLFLPITILYVLCFLILVAATDVWINFRHYVGPVNQ